MSSTRVDADVPPEVGAAARERAEAREARDWETADRLRAEIEAAGWRVVDSGTDYRLEPASPPDVEVGGEIRYGRSDAVPSRLEEPATGLASVVLLASPDGSETRRSLDALVSTLPEGADVVVVADGLPNAALAEVRDLEAAAAAGGDAVSRAPIEIVRTSDRLGHAAALNIGIRRSRAPVVIALDPSIAPSGDVVTPLVAALADPSVAIAGPLGLVSDDLRRFSEIDAAAAPTDATAIQGYLMAFRRTDAAARGPLDEGFRFYRNLDIWWSLVLRDEGEGTPPRRALVVPGLAFERGEPHAWRLTSAADRERLSKRNFYRVLDRFRTREDLAVGR